MTSPYRLSVPFFHLPRGRSALFFDFDPVHDIARPLPLVDAIALALQPELRTSFQGISVRSALAGGELIHQTELPYLVEIDWENPRAGQITVDRITFSLTAEASEAISWLKSRGEELQAMVLSEEHSDYAELNAFLNPLVPPPPEVRWFVNLLDQWGLRWETITFPALNGSSHYALEDAAQARGNGRIVSIIQAFKTYLGINRYLELEWCTGTRAYPNRPAVVSTSPLVITPQYIALPRKLHRSNDFFKGEFPPVWSALAALGNERRPRGSWLWNRDHPLVQTIETEDLEWFASFEPRRLSEDLLQSRGRAALFLMKVLQIRRIEEYLELAEDFRAGFWRDLWDRVAVVPAEIAAWVHYAYEYGESDDGELLVLNSENLERIPATDPRLPQYLPDPGDEWKLTLTYRDDSADT